MIPETPVTGTAKFLFVAKVDKFTLPNFIFVFPPEPIGAYNNAALAWDK